MPTDPRYYDSRGRVKKGKCYKLVGHYATEHITDPDLIIVHGRHKNPDGEWIPHAWVEKDGIVNDLTSGMTFSSEVWSHHNQPFVTYTPMELGKMMLDTQNYGPWDAESNRLFDQVMKRFKC